MGSTGAEKPPRAKALCMHCLVLGAWRSDSLGLQGGVWGPTGVHICGSSGCREASATLCSRCPFRHTPGRNPTVAQGREGLGTFLLHLHSSLSLWFTMVSPVICTGQMAAGKTEGETGRGGVDAAHCKPVRFPTVLPE